MHIAFGLHNKNDYFVHTLTCMYSLLINTSTPLHFSILHDATLTSEGMRCFTDLSTHFGADINFFDVSPHMAPYLGEDMHSFSVATLFRLFIPHFLPDTRVLYMDSDICCNMDISCLFRKAEKLPTRTLYAVQDEGVCLDIFRQHVLELGINPAAYFNAGVTLFDTARLNALFPDFAQKMAASITSTHLSFPDQDALNLYFLCGHGRAPREVGYLDKEYNFNLSIKNRHLLKPERLQSLIVHFGYHKPWEKIFPAALLYWHYREAMTALLRRDSLQP